MLLTLTVSCCDGKTSNQILFTKSQIFVLNLDFHQANPVSNPRKANETKCPITRELSSAMRLSLSVSLEVLGLGLSLYLGPLVLHYSVSLEALGIALNIFVMSTTLLVDRFTCTSFDTSSSTKLLTL